MSTSGACTHIALLSRPPSAYAYDQTLTPVDVLNPNPKDLLRAHSCILNHDEDILQGLFHDSEQLRLGFWVDDQFTAYFSSA
jgi:hypothetical protein